MPSKLVPNNSSEDGSGVALTTGVIVQEKPWPLAADSGGGGGIRFWAMSSFPGAVNIRKLKKTCAGEVVIYSASQSYTGVEGQPVTVWDIISNAYAAVEASPEQPLLPVNGLLADPVRLNVMPSHVTKKFENCGIVELYVNDPEVGAVPLLVVKFIV